MKQFFFTLLQGGKRALLTGFEMLRTLGEATIELGAQGFALLREKTTAAVKSGGEKLGEMASERKQAVLVAVAAGGAVLTVAAGLLLLLRRRR